MKTADLELTDFRYIDHHIIEMQKTKFKTRQYFIQNFLLSKYKYSEPLIKGISKTEL